MLSATSLKSVVANQSATAVLQIPVRTLNTSGAEKSRLRDFPPRLPSELMSSLRDLLAPTDTFPRRHHGDNAAESSAMLALLGYPSLDALADAAVPSQIRRAALDLPDGASESAALTELRNIAAE